MDTPKPIAINSMSLSSIDTLKNKLYLDSLSKARNKQLNDWLKVIGVIGLDGITEAELSVYNEYEIKASMRFDSNLYCTYELVVPLKYLGLNLDKLTTFSYHITLNGAAVNGTNIRDIRESWFAWTGADGQNYIEGRGPAATERVFPTDFWGEYTLIKK